MAERNDLNCDFKTYSNACPKLHLEEHRAKANCCLKHMDNLSRRTFVIESFILWKRDFQMLFCNINP